MRPDDAPLLEVRDLQTHFALRGSFLDRLLGRATGSVKAVDGVSLELKRGEVLGLVGESGSGKTTLGRSILRLIEPTGGSVVFEGTELTDLGAERMRRLRPKMQIVFQDPHASLNPAMDLYTAISDPLRIQSAAHGEAEMRRRVTEVMERVGLVPAELYLAKYPSDLSGGQKQRAVLARAIILGPSLLVADEPVSMLDMSVRAKILELMLGLKEELDLSFLYITHDLATAKFFCDRIAIMYLGRVVETGPSSAIYAEPRHPYTQALLRAIPEPDPQRHVPRDLPRGEVPDAIFPPLGCPFHPRCPSAFEVCGWEGRDLQDVLERHWEAMSYDDYEAERRLITDLNALDVGDASEVSVPATSGQGAALEELLRGIWRESPDDPFWRGVHSLRAEGNAVIVRFMEREVPVLRQEGQVQVSCHLYDPAALEHARALAASRPAREAPAPDEAAPIR
jgi:peptide/nickel transport system ATP-binding protein